MSIVSCPKCDDQVTVPASAPRSARVRCPLCQEEYDLADALAQLPPALIIVSASVADEPVLAGVGGMDAARDSQIGSAIDRGCDSHVDGGSGQGYVQHGFDAGPAPAEMVSAPSPAFRARPRPRRKEKSMVVELVKIVLGGVVGIGLAIVILWWGPGVDLGLAPTIAKVSWMRWVLPQKILNKVERNQGNQEENPDDLQPLDASRGEGKNKGDSQPSSEGKLGSDPRFEKALKSSEPAKASSKFGQSEDAKSAAKAIEKESLDLNDPFAPDSKSSAGVGDLKIESPLSQPKGATKKPEPAKNKPQGSSEDPFNLSEKTSPAKPAVPAEEPVDKPQEEKPAEEKPVATPEEPVETPPKESPAAARNLAAGIDAASSAAKAFDDTDAADEDARKTALVALYNAYAGLARTVEQANLEDADNAEKLPALRQALEQAAADPVKLNSIVTLAARKLDEADGNPGILLAGTVKGLKTVGDLFETTLELVSDKRLVSVVSSKNPQDSYKVDDQVLILGAIVRDPKENLPGYKGEAAVVVKSGHAMVPPMEKTP